MRIGRPSSSNSLSRVISVSIIIAIEFYSRKGPRCMILSASKSSEMTEAPPLVSTDWLAHHLGDPAVVILDASVYLSPAANGRAGGEFRSGVDSFEKNGHIPGARFADLFTQFSDPNTALPFTRPQIAHFEASAGRLGITADSQIVVYDNLANQWAARLWWVFRSFGHRNISVLNGGLRKYAKEGHPLERKLSPYLQTEYVVSRARQFEVTRDDILRIVHGDLFARLVCFLQPDDYAGTTSVRPRAGHIPGSVNLPFSDLVNTNDNTMKSPDELRAKFSIGASPRWRPHRDILRRRNCISAGSVSSGCHRIRKHARIRWFSRRMDNGSRAPARSWPLETKTISLVARQLRSALSESIHNTAGSTPTAAAESTEISASNKTRKVLPPA